MVHSAIKYFLTILYVYTCFQTGLFSILQLRQKILNGNHDPILLLAPNEMNSWLRFYNDEVEPILSEFKFIDNQVLVSYLYPLKFKLKCTHLDSISGFQIENGLSDSGMTISGVQLLQTCSVVHCPSAYGITMVINEDKPFKITYSGDTKPCDSLVKLGLNSTLLIHEATMEDDLIDDALAKMHSTVSQAIEQGHKMNAKYTLLTHFSQRYAKIPRIEQHLVENVGIAFDNMEVVLSDLNELNILYPAMKKMFPDHWEDMEQKSLKRAQKRAIATLLESK